MSRHRLPLGATPLGNGHYAFNVWAPAARTVELQLRGRQPQRVPLERDELGYFATVVEEVEAGTPYEFLLDGERRRPDPASRWQPQGVHGASCVFDPAHTWAAREWHGIPLEDYVIYELHVGTFTREGTFEAVIPHLDALRDLGITAVELMPIAQFPGSRNWGYDGVLPYAAQDSYGGPRGLQTLVDACHRRGMAVILDVVYNHLGPEGNHLADFGPYFTDRYQTPWGRALNFDGPGSDEVRRFFIDNALYWVTDFHVDALRLDAVHAILDLSAVHFLEELTERVKERGRRLNRRVYLIAESDLNDPRLIRPTQAGGYGLDAQWSDDFHHALHALLTGEKTGYYADFGKVAHLARAFETPYVYARDRSRYRERRHGRPVGDAPGQRFVVCAQNHDQVGNRMLGERLTRLASFEELKLAAAAVILSPYVPLLFMGEEYGETAPFPYFISHLDPALVEAVRNGRRQEFAAFRWAGEPPDPQSLATFESAILDHSLRERPQHAELHTFYRELIRLRRELPPLRRLDRDAIDVAASERFEGERPTREFLAPPRIGESHSEPAGYDHKKGLLVLRRAEGDEVALLFHFGDAPGSFADPIPLPEGNWMRLLDSSDPRWAGPGGGLPDEVQSDGRFIATLPAQSVTVLRRR